MARRTTVVDLPGTDQWAELTPEQKQHAKELATAITQRVDKVIARIESIKNPIKRATAADALIQEYVVAIRHLTELRDDSIATGAAERDRADRAEFTRQAAHDLLLSESRIRQLRVHDRIGTHEGSRGDELSRKLTREFLKREYHDNFNSLETIAEMVGCSSQTVSSYMERFLQEDVESGIPEGKSPFRRRDRGEYHAKASAK